jgi:hypothetical protein
LFSAWTLDVNVFCELWVKNFSFLFLVFHPFLFFSQKGLTKDHTLDVHVVVVRPEICEARSVNFVLVVVTLLGLANPGPVTFFSLQSLLEWPPYACWKILLKNLRWKGQIYWGVLIPLGFLFYWFQPFDKKRLATHGPAFLGKKWNAKPARNLRMAVRSFCWHLKLDCLKEL